MRERDQLDDLLDAALSSYADPGRDCGLEQRVLARVSAENFAASTPALRRRWLPWGIALAAACCLFLFVVFSAQKRIHPPSRSVQSAQLSNALPARTAHHEPIPMVPHSTFVHEANRPLPKAQRHSVAVAAKSAPLPKRDVFPTPEPLTPQERALVEFATQVPEPQRRAVVEAQIHDDALLRIADLHIPPIEPPDEGKN
jgi:hypothetical protein